LGGTPPAVGLKIQRLDTSVGYRGYAGTVTYEAVYFMKIAFLFPGQGSQYVGMGLPLANAFEIAKKTYEEASDALGWDMAKLCFEGPEEQLNQTEYTQPALLATSIAVWRSLGISPQSGLCVAGHSLGEYTALVVAGAISFREAIVLVSKRGQFMQSAGEGGMVAIVGLDRQAVEEVCSKASTLIEPVSPANFNAPDQIVIAGERNGLKRAMDLAVEKGAKRVIPLAVSVPSHSPLMKPACERLRRELEAVSGKDLIIPLVNNLEAKVITRWEDARASLVDQLAYPLLWETSIQTIRTMGADCFIEIGPSRVLSGLLKRIDRTVQVISVEGPEGIEKARAVMLGETG
jgi:[acyl-carrier-protein] S-malonyltransferase